MKTYEFKDKQSFERFELFIKGELSLCILTYDKVFEKYIDNNDPNDNAILDYLKVTVSVSVQKLVEIALHNNVNLDYIQNSLDISDNFKKLFLTIKNSL